MQNELEITTTIAKLTKVSTKAARNQSRTGCSVSCAM
jgi:hypothetical protein